VREHADHEHGIFLKGLLVDKDTSDSVKLSLLMAWKPEPVLRLKPNAANASSGKNVEPPELRTAA